MADEDMQLTKQEMYGDGDKPGFQATAAVWLRRIIISLLVIVMLVALVWFALIGPRAAQIASLEGQVATLQAQVEDLGNVEAERDVLSLLADANAARYELVSTRLQNAAAALLNSNRPLVSLDELLGEEYDRTLENLRSRLALVKEDISENNRTAALSDLDVYINILEQLRLSFSSR
jgi:flagellar biosynthesis/type III secretory pathway M-ring protein FliF/YscJ